MNPLKILIADDEIKSLENLKQALSSYDWITETAENGDDALKKLETSHYDVLLTDLNMQKMDGMELISRARAENSSLVIIMITAYEGHLIRKRAFDLGANGFFNKPIDFANLASSISKGLERIKNNNKRRGFTRGVKINKSSRSAHPPYVAVMLAMSTGGPQTIQTIFDALRHPFHSVIFLVQHSPAWALKTLAEHLDKSYDFKVQLAADGIIPEVNQVYIAPGDKHLYINPKTFACQLLDDPPENFFRPSADPLFRSAANAFGQFCMGVVLTGLGYDGSKGGKRILQVGGELLIQDPKTAVAPFMPKAAIEESKGEHQITPLNSMAATIGNKAEFLNNKLNQNKWLVELKS